MLTIERQGVVMRLGAGPTEAAEGAGLAVGAVGPGPTADARPAANPAGPRPTADARPAANPASARPAANPASARPAAGARPAADAASTTGLLARTRFSTWTPGWRTHLLGLACAGLLTLISVLALEPFETADAYIVVVSGIGIAMLSVWPLGASAISLLTSCIFLLALDHGAYLSPVLPAMGPWLCTAVLLTRGFSRVGAYSLLAANVVATFVFFLLSPPNEFAVWQGYLPVLFMGATCLVVAELLRQPRMQVDAAAAQYRADLERQRLLVISELHDTVVRDLTQAVMTAEQARLVRPDAALAGDLRALTASVRTAVEQLRNSLRTLSDADAGDGVGMDVLASSAPRPLSEVVAEARAVLASRRVTLETEGLDALESAAVPPGVRQQLVRVLGELVSNMVKHAAPGSARLLIEADGRSLEAMASNAAGPEHRDERRGEWQGRSAVISSGLGLAGAQRRVEALSGTFDVTRTTERFTAVLSVPLRAAAPG